jgi:capsular exopolysaccharide synthesis family protein
MTTSDTKPSITQSAVADKPLQATKAALADLWRYKWLVPAVAILVTAVVAFWTVRQPKVYEAITTLEYDPHPSQPLGTSVKDTDTEINLWEAHEVYQTQNVLLRSRSLAERIVRKLSLHQDLDFLNVPPEKRASFPGISVERAAEGLMGRIEVSPIRDTRLIRLRVRDGNPERAQLLANTIADTYIEKSLEDRLDTSGRALEWLGTQMQSLKRELEVSERALYNFREANHSLSASLEERQRIITSQLQQYSEALTKVHTQRVQSGARLAVLRELLAAANNDPLSIRPETIARDGVVVSLHEDYRKHAGELEKLVVTYGESHPQVRATRSLIAGILQRMQAQIAALVAGVDAEVRELERAERGIQGALEEVNRQGLALSLQEIEYSRLDRERKNKHDLYNLIIQRAAQTDLTRALRVAYARVVDQAVRPGAPVSPRVQLSVIVGALLGLALGVVAAFVAAQLDNKVRTTMDVETRGVTVIGVMPSVGSAAALQGSYYGRRRRTKTRIPDSDRDLVVHLEPRSSVAECCRTIRTNLTFQSADRPLRTLAVTSAQPQDGKTTVAISVAITLAQGGRRVLIIDTDLRRPRLRKAFKLPTGVGLTSVLAGEAAFEEALQVTDVPNLTLMQCGPIPPNPSELLHTRRFADVVEEAKERFDIIVFDTPPLGAVTDPVIVATQTDGTLLIVRARRTTRGNVDAAAKQLRSVSARIVGAVINDVDMTSKSYGDYYSYYRGYYTEEEPKEPPTGSEAASRS